MAKVIKLVSSKQEQTSKLKVAAYCRVSTDSDDQMESLKAQKKHYETFIKSNPEWQFAGVFYDEGITGTKMEKRRQLLKMLDACEHKEIDLVITKSISRFSRNTVDCLSMVRHLVDHNVYVYFEKENLNTMTMGSELILSILSGMAEEESHSASKNVKWSIQKRFEQGTYIIAYPPYGYINENGEMRIVPEEGEVVKRIFEETVSGKGCGQIATILNNEGFKTKKGKQWHSTTIRELLKNEKYVGDAHFQKTYTDDQFTRHTNNGDVQSYYFRDHHEPIVSRELFESAKVVIEQRTNEMGIVRGTQKYNRRYTFSGIIKCHECGGVYKRRHHYTGRREYITWTCGTHLDNIKKCSQMYIREDAVQAAFTTMMNKLIFGYREVLTPLLDGIDANLSCMTVEKQNEFDKKSNAIKERELVLKDLFKNGLLSPDIMEQGLEEIQQEKRTLVQLREDYLYSSKRGQTYLEAARELFAFCNKSTMLTAYDDEVFKQFVNSLVVFSREEIGFRLNCGITLRERMVIR